jgi:proteasome accessory factor C
VTLTEPAGVTRPLRLTVDEALALVVALRALAETPGLGERDAVDRGAGQGRAGSGRGGRAGPAGRGVGRGRDARAPRRPHGPGRGPALHLSYLRPGPRRDHRARRRPAAAAARRGRSYLEAWCRRAEGVRLFRLDRVADLAVLDEPSAPPEGVEPRDVSQGLFRPGPDDLLVTLGAAARGRVGRRLPPVRVGRAAGRRLPGRDAAGRRPGLGPAPRAAAGGAGPGAAARRARRAGPRRRRRGARRLPEASPTP